MSKVHSYSTRNNVTNQIALPRFSTSRSQKSFKFIGAKLWNEISYSIKQLSYPKFKTEYKIFLLSKYVDKKKLSIVKLCHHLTSNYYQTTFHFIQIIPAHLPGYSSHVYNNLIRESAEAVA